MKTEDGPLATLAQVVQCQDVPRVLDSSRIRVENVRLGLNTDPGLELTGHSQQTAAQTLQLTPRAIQAETNHTLCCHPSVQNTPIWSWQGIQKSA
jgi:hypothetical protein